MSGLPALQAQLDSVYVAAADPRGAYLIRSRLRRVLLSCARAIAELQGLEKPVLPGQWVSTGTDPSAEGVLKICRRIYQCSNHLCQPSESFDVRWEAGWAQLRDDLASLRDELGRIEQLS
jgi:hypothetical protein